MEYQLQGSFLILPAGKDLDHHRVLKLQQLIQQIKEERGFRYIVFDFSGTDFMDSSGVGMIIRYYKEMRLLGGSVCIAGTTPLVDRLFYVSGLHKIIRMYSDVEEVLHEKK